MRTRSNLMRIAAVAAIVMSLLASAVPAAAVPIGDDAFWRTWARTDKPVQDGMATRTWMWGPDAYTDVMTEKYAGPNGTTRTVQYFDKSRMEINNPNSDPTSEWYVSNGLLARELITGEMQVSDNETEMRAPAVVNVAGDPDSLTATTPTYASMSIWLVAPPNEVGSVVTRQILRTGAMAANVGDTFAQYNVTHAVLVDATQHTVASPFWNFLNSTDAIYLNDELQNGQLFDPWFYATGYPITEPYWSRVSVGGTTRDVLVQCFERRCLTYTPDNPAEWQVEMGNVGQHYYRWRYEQWPGDMPAEGATLYQSSLEDWAVYPGTSWVDGALQFVTEPGPNPNAGNFSGGAFSTDQESDGDFEAVSVSIDIRAVAPTPEDRSLETEACIMVRNQLDVPGTRYAFCKDQSGRYRAWFVSSDSSVPSTLLAERRYITRNNAFAWNRLTVATKGDALWFLVDGKVFAAVQHDAYTTGEVGFEVTNYSNGTVGWQFRDLEVKALQ